MPTGLKRYQEAGHLHFLTFSCHRRLPYLAEPGAYAIFEEFLEQARKKHDFCIAGYVLMPEHVHLLVSEPEQVLLADALKWLKWTTSRRLKGSREHFWQARYYAFNVYTEDKQIEKLRYMHRNPVTRGLVSSRKTGRGAASSTTTPACRVRSRSSPGTRSRHASG